MQNNIQGLSKYAVFSAPFFEKNTGKEQQIVFSGLSGEAIIVHPEVVNLIKQGKREKIPENVLSSLCEIGVFKLENDAELKLILQENNDAAVNEETLYHVVQPSAWCQLDCGYCGQTHEKKLMNDNFREKIYQEIKQKLKTKKYKHLVMGWFGGEPLSGFPVIERMSKDLIQIAEEFGVTYHSKMVTNGVALTEKLYDKLVNQLKCFHFEITLDGPKETHDKMRPMKNGKGSFENIMQNLVAIGEKKIDSEQGNAKITLRMNVGEKNYQDVEQLIELLISKKFQWIDGIYFAPIHDWGNDASKQALSMEDFSQLELAWYSKLLKNNFKMNLIPQRKKLVCMALSKTAEVFDSYGDRFNCSELSQVKSFGSPNRFRNGNLDIIVTDKSKRLFSDFNNKIKNGETGCKNCFCLPICGGSCPKAWEEGQAPCPSFKYNLEQRLLLQYASRIQ